MLRNKAKPKYQGLAQYYLVTDFKYTPEALLPEDILITNLNEDLTIILYLELAIPVLLVACKRYMLAANCKWLIQSH